MYCSSEEKIGFQIMTDNGFGFLNYLNGMQRYVPCDISNV